MCMCRSTLTDRRRHRSSHHPLPLLRACPLTLTPWPRFFFFSSGRQLPVTDDVHVHAPESASNHPPLAANSCLTTVIQRACSTAVWTAVVTASSIQSSLMPARPSALARRRARYSSLVKGPHSQDDAAALESLAEEIEGLTISDNGQETTAQSSRLWTSRQQFQETRPLLERVSTASLNTAIVETFQCVSTSNLSPSLAVATSGQLASLSASCSNSSTPPLHTRPPPSSLSGPPDGQRSYATTIEDFPDDNQPRPAARHSPSSRPYILTQAPPPSIAQPVQ